MKTIMIPIVICAALASISCGKKATEPSTARDYFPNDIGSVWVYAVYDSLTEASYDMTVSIVDTATVEDMPVTLWVYEGDGFTDTMFVSVSDDTVTFRDNRDTYLTGMYVFPLSVGEEWNCGQSCVWDYSVDDRGSVDVLAGRFSGAFNITGRFGYFNYYGLNSEWYAPHIGPVRVYRFSICTVCSPMVDVNEMWELKSCHFPG